MTKELRYGSCIQTVAPRRRAAAATGGTAHQEDYGFVPGITQVLLPDLRVAFGAAIRRAVEDWMEQGDCLQLDEGS